MGHLNTFCEDNSSFFPSIICLSVLIIIYLTSRYVIFTERTIFCFVVYWPLCKTVTAHCTEHFPHNISVPPIFEFSVLCVYSDILMQFKLFNT